jgi:hypothetical protein
MKRKRLKKLNLQIGDTLVQYRHYPQTGGRKSVKEFVANWDVISINKKSIVLQNWPTYERRIVR